jgi:hypothetical protein
MTSPMKHRHLLTFGSFMLVAWTLGAFLFSYFWPHIVLNHFKKAILVQGFGQGPLPINTLYTEPQNLFAAPLASQSASGSNLLTVGVNRDTLLTGGWLDLSQGPLVLAVPDFSGRYYSVQFTDPSDGTDFAYVGTRATGTQAGDYLITGPGWDGQPPGGLTPIASPDNSVLVIGRVQVYGDSDLPAAYDLSKQIQLTPLSAWQPSR